MTKCKVRDPIVAWLRDPNSGASECFRYIVLPLGYGDADEAATLNALADAIEREWSERPAQPDVEYTRAANPVAPGRRLYVVMKLSSPAMQLGTGGNPVRMDLPSGMAGFLPVYDSLDAARLDYPQGEILVAETDAR